MFSSNLAIHKLNQINISGLIIGTNILKKVIGSSIKDMQSIPINNNAEYEKLIRMVTMNINFLHWVFNVNKSEI